MCHQSVGLIARDLEAAGYPTIGFTSARTITTRVRPPRSVFLDVPLGHTTGAPGETVTQRQILTDGLEAGHRLTTPGHVIDLPYRWIDDRWKADPLSWSRSAQEAGSGPDGSHFGARPVTRSDTRNERRSEPQYQLEDDRDTADAVSWDEQCRVCLGLAPCP